MRVVQHYRESMQWRISKTRSLDRLHGRQHVIAVDAGLAVALLHVTQLLRQRQPSGILHMAAIDHIGQRADALPRLVFQPHRARDLAIDRGDLLAFAQIGDGRVAVLLGDPEGDAAAGAAAIEPEHEARLFRCSAVDERVNAERAVFPDQPRRNLFDEFEARTPHQRAVAEHPKVSFGEFRLWQGNRRHRGHGYQKCRAKRSGFSVFCSAIRRLHLTKSSAKGRRMPDIPLAPRRRPLWRLFIMPALLVVAAAAWSGFWFY